ncbi:VWA domain-containing protein [Thalassomonas viridans]|uniref:VWA domain-containing protein n=1 Tax=Thalassomonas viridans TaxID=137584 RepID=A0AAE9Z8H7_9GAMM|nr:VWA domain-containing protein [Thalassomonas viridans]WDE08015.1 VWA domain-containing protein [Thalassomonas viridans]
MKAFFPAKVPGKLSGISLPLVLLGSLLLSACSHQEPAAKNEQQESRQQANGQTAAADKNKTRGQTPVTVIPGTPTAEDTVVIARQEHTEAAQGGALKKVKRDQAQRLVTTMEYSGPASMPRPPFPGPPPGFSSEVDRENYAKINENGVFLVEETPVSTFSIDVDTGSYSNMRRMINQGRLPPGDAIRVEELINYFSYLYPVPEVSAAPFSVTTEMAPAPWNRERQLLRIGLKGYELDKSQIKAANLVFLLDVSGSMNQSNKLPLLVKSLKMLTRQLNENDTISIVVYAGASGVVLENAKGNETAKIALALDKLRAGGSTHGSAGIEQAYQLAQQYFIKGGVNRVILATDGDFNVGTVNIESLKDLIARKREAGIGLITLGFGTGNYNDMLMEQLADVGNGNYAYIDTLNEARKVLVDEISSTLQTIAKDVKIQLEFNPEFVAEYRLIGYENRLLKREDFNNDKIDAGEIGAGHTVTALYELTMAGSKARRIDDLRYRQNKAAGVKAKVPGGGDEIAYLRLRYKAPDGSSSKLIEHPVTFASAVKELSQASDDFRFAGGVAAFGQLLKGGHFTENYGYNDVIALINGAKGQDDFGYRGEFVQLVRTTQALTDKGISGRQ